MRKAFHVVELSRGQAFTILGSAALMMTLAMGIRQNFGLFQAPASRELGMAISDFVLAISLFFAFPPTPLSVVLFGAAMGLLWLGVIPLVNGLVVQIFGLRFLSTLIGIAFLSHQAGSFLGAWDGGYLYDLVGSYDLAWKLAVAIGLIAGIAPRPAAGRLHALPPAAFRNDCCQNLTRAGGAGG
jgi:hypothetical protein